MSEQRDTLLLPKSLSVTNSHGPINYGKSSSPPRKIEMPRLTGRESPGPSKERPPGSGVPRTIPHASQTTPRRQAGRPQAPRTTQAAMRSALNSSHSSCCCYSSHTQTKKKSTTMTMTMMPPPQHRYDDPRTQLPSPCRSDVGTEWIRIPHFHKASHRLGFSWLVHTHNLNTLPAPGEISGHNRSRS